jgi:hypothetical protein
VLGDDTDSAGLRPFVSSFFDKPDGCPDLQMRKGSAKNAVLVKIDFASIVRSQKSVTLVRKDFADASLWKRRVALCVASLTPSVILQTPACGLERFVNCDPKILMWDLHFLMLLDLSFA